MSNSLTSVFTTETFKSLSNVFKIGLGLMFIVDLIIITVCSLYIRKRRYPQFLVFLSLAIFVNWAFYAMAKIKLANDIPPQTVQKVLVNNPNPPRREYSIFKKHFISAKREYNSWYAIDEDGEALCLMSGNPPQVYDSSFLLLMNKEGMRLTKKEQMLDMAKFIILLWYNESAPAYFENPRQLGKFLEGRSNAIQKDLGKRIGLILEKETNKAKKENIKDLKPGNLPGLKNAKRGTLRYILGRISPPDFQRDWDGASRFRLYTYSLRYNEIAEWSFTMTEKGMIQAIKSTHFQAITNPSSEAVAK